jgi:CRISPR-associated exonuclease Cas4
VTTVVIALFILLAIAGLAASTVVLRWRARASERRWLPRKLQHAQLAFAEKTFRTWQPVRLIARIDRGYRLNGEVYLAEFKTRPRAVVYSSDVIELSVQRFIIERSTAERVNEIGYVLTQNLLGRHRSVHKVRLLPRAEIIAVARRREAILSGRVVPKFTDSEGLCRRCSYRAECKPDGPDQG